MDRRDTAVPAAAGAERRHQEDEQRCDAHQGFSLVAKRALDDPAPALLMMERDRISGQHVLFLLLLQGPRGPHGQRPSRCASMIAA